MTFLAASDPGGNASVMLKSEGQGGERSEAKIASNSLTLDAAIGADDRRAQELAVELCQQRMSERSDACRE